MDRTPSFCDCERCAIGTPLWFQTLMEYTFAVWCELDDYNFYLGTTGLYD